MNLYAYCGNNPVNWIDPWGLEKCEIVDDAVLPIGVTPEEWEDLDKAERDGMPFVPPLPDATAGAQGVMGAGQDALYRGAAGVRKKAERARSGRLRKAWVKRQRYKYGRNWRNLWRKGWYKSGKPYWQEVRGGKDWSDWFEAYKNYDAACYAIWRERRGIYW